MTLFPDNDYTEQPVSSTLVFDGRLLKVYRDEVRLPDGKQAWREYVQHPGAVMILAQLGNGHILLERQYRYPPRDHFIELPAGKCEAGEAALVTAQRELLEECGYTALSWTHLTTLHPTIGYATEVIHFFVATGLEQVGRQLDEGEFLDVVSMSLDDALALVRDGVITDGKTAYALMWFAQFGVR
jgi:ADP-ribose pyrophosphatase